MTSQNWFKEWLGAIRHQAMIWATIDLALWHHRRSLGHIELFQFCHMRNVILRVSSGQGKVREIPYQAKVRELSGNFVMGQGKLKMWKVRETSGNFEQVMAMVVSWVIWNILDNVIIHCWWSCWHQWLGCQAPMIYWIFHWCQISWYTIFPVTIHENCSLHMKLVSCNHAINHFSTSGLICHLVC